MILLMDSMSHLCIHFIIFFYIFVQRKSCGLSACMNVFVCVQNSVNTATDRNINQSKINEYQSTFRPFIDKKRIIVFQGLQYNQTINQ